MRAARGMRGEILEGDPSVRPVNEICKPAEAVAERAHDPHRQQPHDRSGRLGGRRLQSMAELSSRLSAEGVGAPPPAGPQARRLKRSAGSMATSRGSTAHGMPACAGSRTASFSGGHHHIGVGLENGPTDSLDVARREPVMIAKYQLAGDVPTEPAQRGEKALGSRDARHRHNRPGTRGSVLMGGGANHARRVVRRHQSKRGVDADAADNGFDIGVGHPPRAAHQRRGQR